MCLWWVFFLYNNTSLRAPKSVWMILYCEMWYKDYQTMPLFSLHVLFLLGFLLFTLPLPSWRHVRQMVTMLFKRWSEDFYTIMPNHKELTKVSYTNDISPATYGVGMVNTLGCLEWSLFIHWNDLH